MKFSMYYNFINSTIIIITYPFFFKKKKIKYILSFFAYEKKKTGLKKKINKNK
jgi:hypothetical protein